MHKEKYIQRDKQLQEQLDNIRRETDNPAIINDVVDTDLEAYPGHLEKAADDNEALDNFEEIIVENVVEGKTWNTDRE
jgi:predicted RND superfamily exporter protein